MYWSVEGAASTRARSCASAPSSPRERSSPARRPCTTWCGRRYIGAARTARSRFLPAVVVPGARAAPGQGAARWGLSLYTPVIVKYRDEKTDAATLLEDDLR